MNKIQATLGSVFILGSSLFSGAMAELTGADAEHHALTELDLKPLQMALLLRELVLDKYDSSDTGVLNDEDKKRLLGDAQKAKEKAKEAVVMRFDKDGDGKLSRVEFQAFMTEVHQRRTRGGMRAKGLGPHMAPPPQAPHLGGPTMVDFRGPGKKRFRVAPGLFLLTHDLLMGKYDKDGNAQLSADELSLVVKDARELYRSKMAEMVQLYDLDKDGKLSPLEREQAFADSHSDEPIMPGEDMDEIDMFISANVADVLLNECTDDELGQKDEQGHDE